MTDLEAVAEARRSYGAAYTAYQQAVKAAVAQGARVQQVAEAAGLSRAGVYLILKRQR